MTTSTKLFSLLLCQQNYFNQLYDINILNLPSSIPMSNTGFTSIINNCPLVYNNSRFE